MATYSGQIEGGNSNDFSSYEENARSTPTGMEYEACRRQCRELREIIQHKKTETNDSALKTETKTSSNLFKMMNLQFDAIRIFKGHYGKVYDLNWSNDSKMIISASQDGNLLLWNAVVGHKKIGIKLKSSWVMTCGFSPSTKLVACGGLDNLCTIYEVTDTGGFQAKEPYRELQQHEGYVSTTRFVNENEVLTASGDATCVLWDIEMKTPKTTFFEHAGDVMSLDVRTDRHCFISGSCDSTAKLWDFRAGGKCVGNFTGHDSDVNDVAWFPDGWALGTGSDDTTCRLFDIRAYRQLNVYSSSTALCGVTAVDFSKSGRLLFAGYDDDPFCVGWDVAYSDITCKLVHNHSVSAIGVAPNGGAICTSSWDMILRLWVGR